MLRATPLTSQPPAKPPETSRPARGVLGWLRDQVGGWFGPLLSQDTPAEEALGREKAHAGPVGIEFPWFLPYDEGDSGTGETEQMRLAYRRMLAQPAVKAALLGKLFGVCALKLQVNPADKKNTRDQEVADFVRWNLTQRLDGGVVGLIWNILSGAALDGYSVNEKVWNPQRTGKYHGKVALTALKQKDVGNDLVLKTDSFRNVTSVMGLRYNGGLEFHPSNFVICQHLKMFERPTGMSDLRAAYNAYWMMDTCWKLRGLGLTRKATPLLHGTYQDTTHQLSLDQALAQCKSSNWISTPDSVKLTAIDIAGGSQDMFRNAIQDLREEMFLALTGATLQALVGQQGGQRGSSAVHDDTASLFKWFLSECVCALLNNHDNGLIKDMVDVNYVVAEYPTVTLSAVSAQDLAADLAIDTGLHMLGLPLSVEELRERYSRTAPHDNDPADILPAAQTPAPPRLGGDPLGLGGDNKPPQADETDTSAKTALPEKEPAFEGFSEQWLTYLAG